MPDIRIVRGQGGYTAIQVTFRTETAALDPIVAKAVYEPLVRSMEETFRATACDVAEPWRELNEAIDRLRNLTESAEWTLTAKDDPQLQLREDVAAELARLDSEAKAVMAMIPGVRQEVETLQAKVMELERAREG